MTRRLFYDDAYLASFASAVTEVTDGGHRIYLEATAFYPTSGGQPNDTGVLGDTAVLDVVAEGDRVAHLLATPLEAGVGDVVEGRIDWPRRFDHMQQHTGQHLLSALFEERHGLATVSVHFGAAASTMDLRGPAFDPAILARAERRANAIVSEDRAVEVSYEAATTATGLRKESARQGELRIVSIDGLDRSACGGTHVRRTGEIGAVLLRRWERIRGDIRVEFLCGGRAIARARADYEALAAAAQSLSAPLDDVPALVAAQREETRELLATRRRLEEELAAYRAREAYDRTPADEAGLRRVLERRATGSVDEFRPLAQALTALPRAVLVACVESPPTLLLATSEDSGIDAGAALRAAVTAAGGRGGGSPRVAQGSLPRLEALEAALQALQHVGV